MQQDSKIIIEDWVSPEGWDFDKCVGVQTPCYLISEARLIKNLEILRSAAERTGAKILMSIKSFSMFSVFPLIKQYLPGMEASSLNEARLAKEEFGGEVNIFSPGYKDEEFDEILCYADRIVFNSFSQWKKFKKQALATRKSCGLRVNPEKSVVEDMPLYNPCSPLSRLGVIRVDFEPEALDGLEGFHFHCLCELNADTLEKVLGAFEKKFAEFLPRLKWVNFGGGHHITRQDYDTELLERIIKGFKKRYPHLEVHLEPGEAGALNAGVLVATVVDIPKKDVAILDISAMAHMPDTLNLPYQPHILTRSGLAGMNNGRYGKYSHVYRLGSLTCAAGDFLPGVYSFPEALAVGDKLVLLNMAIYTMTMNTNFNGVQLPSIALLDKDGKVRVIRKFGYEDFRSRLS